MLKDVGNIDQHSDRVAHHDIKEDRSVNARLKSSLVALLCGALVSSPVLAAKPKDKFPIVEEWQFVLFKLDANLYGALELERVTIYGPACADNPECRRTYDDLVAQNQVEIVPDVIVGDLIAIQNQWNPKSADVRCNPYATDVSKQTTSHSDLESRWQAAFQIFTAIKSQESIQNIKAAITSSLPGMHEGKLTPTFTVTYADGGSERWFVTAQGPAPTLHYQAPTGLKQSDGVVKPCNPV